MNTYYHDFMSILEEEDRGRALDFALSKLKNKEMNIHTLYTELLAAALNSMTPQVNQKAFIWKEHVRSSIIRTIIENCYPYVLKERDEVYKIKNKKSVAVVCPTEEYHEIGARMITDFFTLLGYNSIFVGSNTPKEEFIEAPEMIHFDYIAISVSNPYHLITARKTIEKIKEFCPSVKIVAGGSAFANKPSSFKEIGADLCFNTFQELAKLAEEDRV